MTTISPNRKRDAARARFFLQLAILLIIVGMVALLRGPLSNLLWAVGGPLEKTRNTWVGSVGAVFSSFAANHTLVLENQQLKLALASSSAVLLDHEILVRENNDLKNRLGRVSPQANVLLAMVLVRPPATPYDTLVLDVGNKDGVAAGDLVSAGGSVYIGKITEVYENNSRVKLFSAPGESHSATLLQTAVSSSLPVSIAGQGGGSFTAEVPAGTLVRIGDEVVFNDIGTAFVAKVVQVEEKSRASFTTIYLQLPVNMYTLRMVEVRRATSAPYVQ